MLIGMWKNLRLQSQIFIMQSLTVAVIFAILMSLCFYLVQIFANFIQSQLLQELVLRSMITTIMDAVIRVDRIDHRLHYKYLFEFQAKNDIYIVEQNEDCFFDPHGNCNRPNSGQFNSITQSDINARQIRTYISLQNQFIPFVERDEVRVLFNIIYEKEIVFQQKKEILIQNLDQQAFEALQFMKEIQQQNFFLQIQNQTTEQILMALQTIADSKVIIGSLVYQNYNPYYQMVRSDQYFNQRSICVLESGFIISDTSNYNSFGNEFQNTSFTGFNHEQFQKIKNFANKNGTLLNECLEQIQHELLCLIDINNKQQLVFSRYINLAATNPYYVIVIVDAKFLHRIEEEFNFKLKTLIDNILLSIGLGQVITVVLSLIIQILIIQKLNKPLEDLKSAAKFHINNCQHTFQMIASLNENLNQTQKLTDAFFNLVTHSQRNKCYQQYSQDFQTYSGIIPRRMRYNILISIWRNTQKLNFDNN